jgi:zinc D-Ala-D-Ala carboxypeptidase
MTATLSYEQQVAEILRELGIEEIYKKRKSFSEATELASIDRDIYERDQKLAPKAAISWLEMKSVAENDGIILLIVSAFRGMAYQNQIIQRKLAAGQKLEQILRVSAAPGYSEHHTGRAIDITTHNCKQLTEEFEQTPAFDWLNRRANDFGFVMSYPRNNQLGVIYEPWHWTFRSSD